MYRRAGSQSLDLRCCDLVPQTARNMWCTGPFLHAANREIHQTRDNRWIAIPSKKNTDSHAVEVYRIEPIRFKSVWKDENEKTTLEFRAVDDAPTTVQVFRYTHPAYNGIMTSVLKTLLETL